MTPRLNMFVSRPSLVGKEFSCIILTVFPSWTFSDDITNLSSHLEG